MKIRVDNISTLEINNRNQKCVIAFYIYIFLKKYYTPKRLDTLLLHLEVQPVIQVDNFPVIRLSR